MSFKTGFVNELCGKATRDGVSRFNVENVVGTAIHAFAGFLVGIGVRKAVPADTFTFHLVDYLPWKKKKGGKIMAEVFSGLLCSDMVSENEDYVLKFNAGRAVGAAAVFLVAASLGFLK